MNKNCNSSMSQRPHLTKEQRLPKCYKETEKMIKSIKSCKSNFKTALSSSRFRGANHRKVYKLTLSVLKHYNYIQKLIDKTQLLEKEKFLRKEIASILIYELIFGKGYLPGESKVVSTIQAYQNDLMKVHQEFKSGGVDIFELNEIYIPRYARVHTLVTTVPYVIKDLENCGFKQISYSEDLSEESYLQLISSLENGTFLVDFHFNDILVFAQDENLIGLDLYNNGHIFLQDKASYIPVHALNPAPGCTVLDACAAPGMKSVHIASKMKNKGVLIACEKDENRFATLKETLQYGAVKISKMLCMDFKLIDPYDQAYSTVEYILLDPSCSGSGMINRMDEVTDTEDSKNMERLRKLSGFQIILLKHALRFPSVKRVVYSTCSIHELENEYVVHEALNAFNNTFKLVPVMSEWKERGLENYEYGKLCLRTISEKHLTNGFFVAMFERIEHHEGRKGKHSSVNYIECEISARGSDTKLTSKENFEFVQSSKQYKNSSTSDTSGMFLNTSESYENFDQNDKDKLPSSYDAKKGKKFNTSEFTKNKKEKGNIIAIQFQPNDTKQEDIPNVFLESRQKSKKSKKIKSLSPFKMPDGLDENPSALIGCKKSKHKRHPNTKNIPTIYTEMPLDVKSKHKEKKKKKEHSIDENISFTETDEIISEGRKLQTSEFVEKKRKEENVIGVQFQPNDVKQEDMSYTFSESLHKNKKSKKKKSSFLSAMCDAMNEDNSIHIDEKILKSKRHREIYEINAEIPVDVMLKHKKKKRKKEHSTDENISFTGTDEIYPENQIDCFPCKPIKKNLTTEYTHPATVQLESFENKPHEGGNHLAKALIKVKKSKKHKKHSKNSDF